MTGFGPLLRKELVESLRTWRSWILGGLLLALAITGPVLALFTNQILRSIGGSAQITLPDPTYRDAYAQWAKNLAQFGILVVLVIASGLVNSEVKQGTGALVLAKPVSRTSFVLAKFVGFAVTLVATLAVTSGVTWGVTFATFGSAPWRPLAALSAVWLVAGLAGIALGLLASCVIASPTGAAGAAVGVAIAGSIAAAWGPVARWTPFGLSGAAAQLGAAMDATWRAPVVTGLLVIPVLLALAIGAFRRRELG